MKQCAQCAQEIPESETICESCRIAALDRLFDEALLKVRPAPVAPATPEPLAEALPVTPSATTAPTVPDPADVLRTAAVERTPAVEWLTAPGDNVRPVPDAHDALRPPTLDELRQLSTPATPAFSDSNATPAPDLTLDDDWDFPVPKPVRPEPEPPAVPPAPAVREEYVAPPARDEWRPPVEDDPSEPKPPIPTPRIADELVPQSVAANPPSMGLSEEAPGSHQTTSPSSATTANAPTIPEGEKHPSPGPVVATDQPVAAAKKPAEPLGLRKVAMIAMTLILGGTAAFAMLRGTGPTLITGAPAGGGARPTKASASAKASAPVKAATSATRAAAPAHAWQPATRDWVGGNQRRAAAFEVPSNNRVAIWTRQAQPILVVRCVAKKTEAFVFIESAAQLESQSDHSVELRFDDEPEIAERWPDSDRHDALFAPDGAAFARKLESATTLHFGYKPHNAPHAVAEFNVSGLAELLTPLAKECGAKK